MKKKRRNGGFTLAELLIVVAIIGVLSGVAFVAVQNHEKSMTQLELDTVAKEIFIAAQNHLTLAKGQNYSGNQEYGSYGTNSEDSIGEGEQKEQIVYYFTNSDLASDNLLSQMLPFGSIDDTIRAGGDYLIRYQPSAGVVLDVFYWKSSDKKYGGSDSAYNTLMGLKGEEKKGDRRSHKPMIGWFGGEGVVDTGEFLKTPSIEVINAEKLYVKVTDKNVNSANTKIKDLMKPMLKLIITGESSGAKMAFTLNNINKSNGAEGYNGALVLPAIGQESRLTDREDKANEVSYIIVLDDITTRDMRFADLAKEEYLTINWQDDKRFSPGEDITIQAVAYSNTALSSVAYSGEWTVNSLFGGLRAETGGNVALISNIRHLENLDEKVSDVGNNSGTRNIPFVKAEQTTNLDWATFKDGINRNLFTGAANSTVQTVSVYSYITEGETTTAYATKPDCYMPVSPGYALKYSGQSIIKNNTSEEKVNHSAANITVDDTGEYTLTTGVEKATIPAGGMFGTLGEGCSVSNLALVDFTVNLTSGDAGALAGTITDTTVSNVVAYNSSGITDGDKRLISASGAAGGLIGAMSQSSGKTSKVEKSAAALIVSSTGGNAGGLIGTASGGTVSACYSGGHTVDKKDKDNNIIGVLYNIDNYNVTASNGVAGGLIGDAGSTTIDHSYSTCSATGKTAGGFVGKASGNISYCYATGLVCGTDKETDEKTPKDGAFAYSATGTVTGCQYFEIINERPIKETKDGTTTIKGYQYLSALGKNITPADTISPFDKDAASYNAFVGSPEPVSGVGGWKNASVYDPTLTTYYGTVKDGKTVSRYSLPTVAQLLKKDTDNANDSLVQEEDKTENKVTTSADYVATHYGDWPAPEIFVVNVKQSDS